MKLSQTLTEPSWQKVAPLAGAWVEIRLNNQYAQQEQSLPSRERGLKYAVCMGMLDNCPSLPSRERGLKL